MRFSSSLTCIALMVATLQPVTSLNIAARAPPPNESAVSEGGQGWGIFKYILDRPEDWVADAIFEKLYSSSAPVHKVNDGSHFTELSFGLWDKIKELAQSFNVDGLFRYAKDFQPSEKVDKFKASLDSVVNTATTLHQLVTEQHDARPDSVKEELAVIFNDIFEKLKEQFPPPSEALGHENRTVRVRAVLDSIEETFSQFFIKLGADDNESLEVHSDLLKFHIQVVVVTIGDLIEQHPELAVTLLFAAMIEMGLLRPLLAEVLKMFGFGPLGPIKGRFAAWLQRWLYPSAVPKGGWFAALQRLAMTLFR